MKWTRFYHNTLSWLYPSTANPRPARLANPLGAFLVNRGSFMASLDLEKSMAVKHGA
jgi:hypothetical protein